MIDARFMTNLPSVPGVYQMLDGDGATLYVGKARNLKKRVASYFRKSGMPPKTAAMMRRVEDIQVTITHTENEALILENNLIKTHRPRYNVVLRDDKSYPYIYLDDQSPWPRLSFYRGNRKEPGRYFGPYANAGAVRQTLSQLQKVFPVRQCEDTFFKNRSRPCLQYQIKRCSAPCVGLATRDEYLEDVEQAILFLLGKDGSLNEYLAKRMETAAKHLNYETAAQYRDRIAALHRLQEQQHITAGTSDLDIVVLQFEHGQVGIEVGFVRGGRYNGNKSFFPVVSLDLPATEIMASFLTQFYLSKSVPPEILCDPAPFGIGTLAAVLSTHAGRRVMIKSRPRGARARWLEMARLNGQQRLQRHLLGQSNSAQRIDTLCREIGLAEAPGRIECFDVSHTMGEATVASCVVFEPQGPANAEYRRFNIRGVAPGDDYAALSQALQRRYRKVKEGDGVVPDLVIIDGGKGQLSAATQVFDELQLDGVTLLAVAKGTARKPGLERLFMSGRTGGFILKPDSKALHLIQHIRDEAHRFAIAGHRGRRSKKRLQSPLQEIPGIGAKRRQALLTHLGGLQEVARAGVDDLVGVPGIDADLARKIYAHFHG